MCIPTLHNLKIKTKIFHFINPTALKSQSSCLRLLSADDKPALLSPDKSVNFLNFTQLKKYKNITLCALDPSQTKGNHTPFTDWQHTQPEQGTDPTAPDVLASPASYIKGEKPHLSGLGAGRSQNFLIPQSQILPGT